MAKETYSSILMVTLDITNCKKTRFPDVYRYIHWLNVTGKLDEYLDRSISYIYMRDLGKALDTPETQARIQRVVQDTKKYFMRANGTERQGQPDFISLAALYRWAQKENVELP